MDAEEVENKTVRKVKTASKIHIQRYEMRREKHQGVCGCCTADRVRVLFGYARGGLIGSEREAVRHA